MRAIALILRVFGNGMRHVGTLAERIYDLPCSFRCGSNRG